MFYVYAATKPSISCDNLEGLDGSRVELQPFGPIALAISRHELRPQPTAAHIAAHHRVTIALAEAGGAAPFRFGNVFDGEEELRNNLEPRQSELEAQLDRLAGCVEVVVHLREPEPQTAGSGGQGTMYLLRKKSLAEAEQRAKDQLSAIVRDCRRSQRGSQVHLACLVEVDRVAELKARVAELDVTGPWAPSSFV